MFHSFRPSAKIGYYKDTLSLAGHVLRPDRPYAALTEAIKAIVAKRFAS